MKKLVFTAIICISLISLFAVSVSASSINSGDTDLVKFSSQLSSEQLSLLKNSDLYDDSMSGITVEDQPIVIIYNEMFWNRAEQSLEVMVKELTEKSILPDYVLLNETSTRIQTLQKSDGQMTIRVRETYAQDTLPTYLQDLISSNGTSCKILGENRTIANVICFDGSSSHQGIAVYYVTDSNDTYVRYYESRTDEAVEFSLADFQKHGVAYNEYITSDEYNYTKDGEPLYGGTVSFVEFIHSDITKADEQPEFPIAIVIAISAAFLAAIVALIYIIRKKKITQTMSDQ